MYENYLGEYIKPEIGLDKNIYKNASTMQIVEVSKNNDNEHIFKCRNVGNEEFYNHLTVTEVHSYFRRLSKEEIKDLPNFVKKDALSEPKRAENEILATDLIQQKKRRPRP